MPIKKFGALLLALALSALAAFAFAGNATAGPATPPGSYKYTVAVWQMPSWAGQYTPVWPQTLVNSTRTTAKTPLAADVPDVCGTQYKIDVYLTSKLPKSGLPKVLHAGDDTGWFDTHKPTGWGHDYSLLKWGDCIVTTPVAPTVVAGVCDPKTGVDSPPAITLDTTADGISYQLDGLVVTATLLDTQHVWVDPLPAGWTLVDPHDGISPYAQYTVTIQQPPCEKQTPTPTPTPTTQVPTPTPTPTTPAPTPHTSVSHHTPAHHPTQKHTVPHSATPVAPASPVAHRTQLANTGSHTGMLLAIGLVGVVAGVALLMLGTGRRS